MYHSLEDSPLVTDTRCGIRIVTMSSKFADIRTPGIHFVSMVLLPCSRLDAIEIREYETERQALSGHAELVSKHDRWTRDDARLEIERRLWDRDIADDRER